MTKLSVLKLPPADLVPIDEETVMEPDEIESQLSHVLLRKTMLGVAIDTSADIYLSHMLELVPGEGYLVLDELAPITGHRRIEPGSRLLVTARTTGALVRFYTEVLNIGTDQGMGYYKVRWPRVLGVQQRRKHYRVFVPFDQGVPVMITTDNDLRLTAELRDLSVSGFSARLPDGGPLHLRSGQILPRCSLELPDSGRLVVPIEIRHHLPPQDERRSARLGARFLRVTPQDQRQLERLVRALERESQRRQQQGAAAS